MSVSKSDKHEEYARYATCCLEMTAVAKDHDARVILREMAAEWLKLAEVFESVEALERFGGSSPKPLSH